jgi:hypothetical protein
LLTNFHNNFQGNLLQSRSNADSLAALTTDLQTALESSYFLARACGCEEQSDDGTKLTFCSGQNDRNMENAIKAGKSFVIESTCEWTPVGETAI